MGELTVTGLDEDVLARLGSRAAAHGRSVEEEAQQVLTLSVQSGQDPTVLDMLAEARRQTSGSIRSNTLDLIREGWGERA